MISSRLTFRPSLRHCEPRIASSAPLKTLREDRHRHRSISNCAGEDGRIALPAIVRIEVHVVPQVENKRRLSDDRGVGQTRPNGVDAPLEWPENVAGPRVTRELPIVVPNHTDHKSRSKFESRSPLEMKFVAALVVGRR